MEEQLNYETRHMVVIMESTKYERGMFRQLADELSERIPRDESVHRFKQWQLSDDLESTLHLVLFPSVAFSADKRLEAEEAFTRVTGAPPKVRAAYWNLDGLERVAGHLGSPAPEAAQEQAA